MVEELDGEHQVGNGPAVDPAGAVLALSSPLPLLQLPLPYMLTLATHQPGGLVQREEDVVAGVGVRQEGGEVELLSGDFEDKGNGVGEEVGEGKSELDGEKLAADCQEGIFRVAAKINHSFESRMSFIEEEKNLLAVSIQLNSLAGVRSSNSLRMNWKRQVYGTKLNRSGGDLR